MTPTEQARAFFSSATLTRLVILFTAILFTIMAEWPMHSFDTDFGDEVLRDVFIRLHAAEQPEERITVVDIDEDSLAAIGPWPWPRRRIADLVENLLGRYGARGVALDLVLPEPADKDGDARLAALAEHGPVVLAQAFDYVHRTQGLRVGHLAGEAAPPAQGTPAQATGYIANHRGLALARHVGNIGFVPDSDGTLRRLPMITAFDNKTYPTLSLALAQCCAGVPSRALLHAGFRRIAYNRSWDSYAVVPAAAIIAGKTPVDLVRDRLVLVGSSSLGLTDRVATPLGPSVGGVMVHATVLSTLLDEHAGQTVSAWPARWLAVLFSMLLALTSTYTFPRLSALSNVAFLASAAVLWTLFAYAASFHDPALSTTGPLLSILFLLTVAVPFDWQLAQKKSRSLLGTLRQYVATSVVDELLRRDLKSPLTPRALDVTTLIADMEGYTTYVESLPIEEAASLTRDFLACLTKPVLEQRGTIDKYTGDGLVAFWGAPLPQEDHADLALDAAQEIVRAVQRFSVEREINGMSRLRVRIGIQSGIAMAGDFGSASRSIYTAVGDSVNVAARLEQVARNQPHDIIVGQGTVDRSQRHQFELIGEINLRGREHPITVYTVADVKEAAT
jgi:adenylate cyclase